VNDKAKITHGPNFLLAGSAAGQSINVIQVCFDVTQPVIRILFAGIEKPIPGGNRK
jgi:hypothetical protein